MNTINKKNEGTQVAPKLTLRPLRATLRVGYLRCAPVLASVSLLGILYFACFAVNLPAQTTLSGDHVITGDLNVGTSGATGHVLVTGDAGSSAAPGLSITGDGGVVFGGSFGVGQIPAAGAGTRFMWYPKKAALRAGYVDGTQWDDSNVGNYSTALGEYTIASGEASTAMGTGSSATGYASTAMGYWVYASGEASTAMGDGAGASGYGSTAMGASYAGNDFSTAMGASYAGGNSSTAMSGGYAGGASSTAMGYGAFAVSDNSTAMGYFTTAGGGYSTAMGAETSAWGNCSTAMGVWTSAGGFASTAMGYGTIAGSYASVAIGRGNVGGFDSENLGSVYWVESDPLFEVGNGTADDNDPPEVRNRNAFTIYKNGKIQMQRQGDILMGEFGNPE